MNAEQKKFVEKKLIPFIMREQGRGFIMDDWLVTEDPGDELAGDGLIRRIPKCGTVCCIGGSIEALSSGRYSSESSCGKKIGLTPSQANGLFYGYSSFDEFDYGWPEKFIKRFAKAKTTYMKAKVACDLLKEVVKTEGSCLDPIESGDV